MSHALELTLFRHPSYSTFKLSKTSNVFNISFLFGDPLLVISSVIEVVSRLDLPQAITNYTYTCRYFSDQSTSCEAESLFKAAKLNVKVTTCNM